MADFFIFRLAADVPAGSVPEDMLERWFMRSRIAADATQVSLMDGKAVAVKTDELLDDGASDARAEVWEVRLA